MRNKFQPDVPQQANPFAPDGNLTRTADEEARDVEEAKEVAAAKKKADKKPLLTDEEANALARFKVQGSLSQPEAQEYHRLLTQAGE